MHVGSLAGERSSRGRIDVAHPSVLALPQYGPSTRYIYIAHTSTGLTGLGDGGAVDPAVLETVRARTTVTVTATATATVTVTVTVTTVPLTPPGPPLSIHCQCGTALSMHAKCKLSTGQQLSN